MLDRQHRTLQLVDAAVFSYSHLLMELCVVTIKAGKVDPSASDVSFMDGGTVFVLLMMMMMKRLR